jgi:hypothetical protein
MSVEASQRANPGFQAHAVTRSGLLEFEAPIATMFPLFTAEGERVWAKGWDPRILYPLDRDAAEGMVFQTRDDRDMLLTWTMFRYDEANHAVGYNVFAPDYLVRRIEVRCRPAAASRTKVEVTDSYVGLSVKGNEFVDQLTEAKYADKMANWKEWIGGYLAGIAKAAR